VGDYRKLLVWERSHRLTLEVYGATSRFPKDELFGLTSQVLRSAASIPANIAEGCGRNGDVELARYITIAMGSANELDYHLLLARDLGYLSPPHYDQLSLETQGIAKMLAGFITRLREPLGQQPKADSR
jgi:four helix bundle protein